MSNFFVILITMMVWAYFEETNVINFQAEKRKRKIKCLIRGIKK